MPRDFSKLSVKQIVDQYADPEAKLSGSVLRALARDPRSGVRRLAETLARRARERKHEALRLDAMLHFERILWRAGISRIAGVDEVGMGPLAGPVVAAAVIFPPEVEVPGLDDSKALLAESRLRLDLEIRQKALAVGVGVVEVEEIDRLNIYHAGLRAMRLALESLPIEPQHVLVDSRTIPDIAQPQNAFDKGDGLNFSIAAASVVAKVYRDRVMAELDALYPGYGFASHKGYATLAHQQALRQLGPSPIHRRSFDFLHEVGGGYSELYYDLKAGSGQIASEHELAIWEARIAELSDRLSAAEQRKLRLLRERLRGRLARRRA